LVSSGTISYEMNRFALKLEKLIQNKTIDPETLSKVKAEVNKAVEDWKRRLLPE